MKSGQAPALSNPSHLTFPQEQQQHLHYRTPSSGTPITAHTSTRRLATTRPATSTLRHSSLITDYHSTPLHSTPLVASDPRSSHVASLRHNSTSPGSLLHNPLPIITDDSLRSFHRATVLGSAAEAGFALLPSSASLPATPPVAHHFSLDTAQDSPSWIFLRPRRIQRVYNPRFSPTAASCPAPSPGGPGSFAHPDSRVILALKPPPAAATNMEPPLQTPTTRSDFHPHPKRSAVSTAASAMSPSGVLASPASVLDLPTPAERGRVGSKLPTPLESLSPNTTVGQFSYAPATQTTIVTTTTTTTTSFPPLVLKAPRHLSQLDPKRYPLASSPTPQILKNVRFDFAGTPTYFRESENASQTLCEVSRHSPARRVTPAPPTADASAGDGLIHLARHTDAGTCQLHRENACLTASDGVLQTVSKFAPQYDTPQSGTSSARTPSAKYASGRAFARPLTRSKKRPASPVSISEAAELAQLQRRDQKRREFREISQTAVPTLADLSRRCRKNSSQRSDASTLKLSIGSSEGASQVPQVPATRHHALHPLAETHDHEGTPTPLSPHSAPSKNASFAARDGVPDFLRDETQDTPRMMGQEHEQDQGQDHRHGNEHERASEPGIETAVNLAAATPPIADTDLQPLEPSTASETLLNRPSLPSHLNLSVIQDASLPSPSLSPVTAALSHANAGDYFGADADDDIESSFELPPPEDGRRMGEYRVSKPTTPRGSQDALFALRPPSEADFSNRQLPSPTLMEIPTMLDSFDAMPAEMQTYLMYQFLRRCSKPTLQFVAEVVNPALKCDFLTLLPLELSLNILRSLDFRSLCRAAQVSRKWRQIVDSDERAWKELFDQDNFVLAEGELQRAIREGWGWQHPHGVNACERDLNATTATRPDGGDTASALMMTRSGSALSRGSVATDEADPEHLTYSTPQSGRPKRKAAAKYASRKQPRRRERPRTQADDAGADGFLTQLSVAEGPYAAATAAAAAVPNPAVGLSSLKNLHLHKSLYARHYAIRKHWMMADTNPQHLAFRAHDRHVVTCLQFDTDKILTGSDDTNINVYDTKTGALRTRLEGHEGGVWALQYEGNVLVSGSTDRSVRVWDIEKGLCTQVFQGHTSTVRCLQILMPTQVGEAIDGRPIMAPKQPLIITGSRDASLRVWKLPQPGDKSFFQAGPAPNDTDCPYFVRTLAGHLHSVRAIAAHADTLVSGSYDCTVRVWKISTGETVHRLHGHAQKVYSVVLDHERNRCISGSMDNLVKVWSLETGAVLYSLEGHTSLVGLLDLSHDRLVSAAADSTLRIWDPETGQCKSVLSAHTGAITCFQHDGEKVISGSDRTLKMWNVRTGEYVRDLLTDLSGVWQVKFNGRRCVAAVQRENLTYIEVLDFGAMRDGVPEEKRGNRIVVDAKGEAVPEMTDGELDENAVEERTTDDSMI